MATFVLIPGGWQGGWVYGPLAGTLAARGHTAFPATLPGLGDVPHPNANLDDHIGAVIEAVRPLGGDLVLVGHSYGGMVLSGVADAASSMLRALVYVDAYVPEDGESCWSLTTPRFREMFIAGARADGRTCAPPPGMDPRCRPHPMGTFLQSIRLTGRWREVPRKVHVGAFGWDGSPFHGLHRRLGGDPAWTTRAFDCGHNVARLQPGALAEVLLAQAWRRAPGRFPAPACAAAWPMKSRARSPSMSPSARWSTSPMYIASSRFTHRRNVSILMPDYDGVLVMRLFTATLATETNTFSPLPTSLESYRETVFFRPGEHPNDAPQMCTSTLFVARRRASDRGFTLVEGSCFAASPAGLTNRLDYETMRDEIMQQVAAALPLDGVLLGLHGAMVAHGYEDVEGDIIERVRQLVGSSCVIGVELDPHCHLTLKRVRLADIIVLYKEFPHTDVVEGAEALLDIVLAAVGGQVRPVSSLYDCRQIGSYPTTLPLMRGFVDRIKAIEGRDGVLSISVGHCFPYADVPEVSGRILVVTDNDKAKGDRLATQLGEEFVGMRGRSAPEYLSVAEGLEAALAEPVGPVVVADPADNAGGGAASDNTTILRYLIDRAAASVALAPIWDPVAVRLCFDAGLHATFPLRFGGKIGPASGPPVDATVRVIGLKRNCWQTFGPSQSPLGDCAAIRIGGVEVVLISKRNQALGLELFSNVGIDPVRRQLLVVKSTNHFMAAFGPVARRVIYVDSDGPMIRDYSRIPYTRVNRPIWPLDGAAEPGLIL